jgi:hypothetical protein
MCSYCKKIRIIKDEDECSCQPLTAETEDFPQREKLILAKLKGKFVFYGFNKYRYEDDSIYDNINPQDCPMCGRKL